MDSTGRIVSCMQLAALDLELPSLADPVVCSIIGLGLPEAIATLYPQLDDDGVEAMRDRYAFHFIAAEQTPSALYPAAEQVLTHLRESGFKLAVATGKSRKGLQRCGEIPVWTVIFMPPVVPMKASPSRIRPWCWSCWRPWLCRQSGLCGGRYYIRSGNGPCCRC